MLLTKQETDKYKYAFVYYFDQDVLNFCRAVKDELGYRNFGFYQGRWRFNDLRATDLIKNRYEATLIDESIKKDIEKYKVEKKL